MHQVYVVREVPQILCMIRVSFLFPFILQPKAHLLQLQNGVSSGMWSWFVASAGVAGAGVR